jgi:Uma2 family endonuclease
VHSPSARSLDMLRKRGDYDRLGVPELWVLDPASASAPVLRSDGGRFVDLTLDATDALTSPLLPGFAVTVGSLFVG